MGYCMKIDGPVERIRLCRLHLRPTRNLFARGVPQMQSDTDGSDTDVPLAKKILTAATDADCAHVVACGHAV